MRDKLLKLMKNEGLKSSQLAEMLEVNPAGISHILAGRNKPGFDLLQKILQRFPQINPDWLLLDSNVMYRENVEQSQATYTNRGEPVSLKVSDGMLDYGAPRASRAANETVSRQSVANPNAQSLFGSGNAGTNSSVGGSPEIHSVVSNSQMKQTNIERIVIFYEDKTFESFNKNND